MFVPNNSRLKTSNMGNSLTDLVLFMISFKNWTHFKTLIYFTVNGYFVTFTTATTTAAATTLSTAAAKTTAITTTTIALESSTRTEPSIQIQTLE